LLGCLALADTNGAVAQEFDDAITLPDVDVTSTRLIRRPAR
jgi:hypothetical protein